jgi:osmotically-inducible protein OsmY
MSRSVDACRSLALLVVSGAISGCAATPTCAVQLCVDDSQIRTNVEAALSQDKEFLPGSVYVRTHNRVVYLYGIAETDFECRNAEAIARATPGVSRVVDLIGVVNR